MNDQNDPVELTAPDTITLKFVSEVIDAMQWRRPVAPNAILRCLLWSIETIYTQRDNFDRISEIVAKGIEETTK